jgi:hypothetical protein
MSVSTCLCSVKELCDLQQDIKKLAKIEITNQHISPESLEHFRGQIRKLSKDDLGLLLSFAIDYLSLELIKEIVETGKLSLSDYYSFCTSNKGAVNIVKLYPLHYLVYNVDNFYNSEAVYKNNFLPNPNSNLILEDNTNLIATLGDFKIKMIDYLVKQSLPIVFDSPLQVNGLTPLQTSFKNIDRMPVYMDKSYQRILSFYTDGSSEINPNDKFNPNITYNPEDKYNPQFLSQLSTLPETIAIEENYRKKIELTDEEKTKREKNREFMSKILNYLLIKSKELYIPNLLSAPGFKSGFDKMAIMTHLLFTGAIYNEYVYQYIYLTLINSRDPSFNEKKKTQTLQNIKFTNNLFPSYGYQESYKEHHFKIINQYLNSLLNFYQNNKFFNFGDYSGKRSSTQLNLKNYSNELRNILDVFHEKLDYGSLKGILDLNQNVLKTNMITDESQRKKLTGIIYINNFYLLKLGNLFVLFSQEELNFLNDENYVNFESALEARLRTQIALKIGNNITNEVYGKQDSDFNPSKYVPDNVKEEIRGKYVIKLRDDLRILMINKMTNNLEILKSEQQYLNTFLKEINNDKIKLLFVMNSSQSQYNFIQEVVNYRNDIDHYLTILPVYLDNYKTKIEAVKSKESMEDKKLLNEISNIKSQPIIKRTTSLKTSKEERSEFIHTPLLPSNILPSGQEVN